MDHMYSLGNKGSIMPGDCQWMTAGSGILHQEMPISFDKMLGAQLWVNLPAKNNMSSPRYRDLKTDIMPILEEEGDTIKIILRTYKGYNGVMNPDYAQVFYLDVEVKAGRSVLIPTKTKDNIFVYIICDYVQLA